MAKDWLHRISYEWDVSRRLLDEGYLSIGWARVANSGIQKMCIRDRCIPVTILLYS